MAGARGGGSGYRPERRFVPETGVDPVRWRWRFFTILREEVPEAIEDLEAKVLPVWMAARNALPDHDALTCWQYLAWSHEPVLCNLRVALLEWAEQWGLSPGKEGGWREEPETRSYMSGKELEAAFVQARLEANQLADIRECTEEQRSELLKSFDEDIAARLSTNEAGERVLEIVHPRRTRPGDQCEWVLEQVLWGLDSWAAFTRYEEYRASAGDTRPNSIGTNLRIDLAFRGVAYYDPFQGLDRPVQGWNPIHESENEFRARIEKYIGHIRTQALQMKLQQASSKANFDDHARWLIWYQVLGWTYDEVAGESGKAVSTLQEAVAGTAALLMLPLRATNRSPGRRRKSFPDGPPMPSGGDAPAT